MVRAKVSAMGAKPFGPVQLSGEAFGRSEGVMELGGRGEGGERRGVMAPK